MAKKLMKGNEAIAEAAIQAGCRFFFGYPITPQNQIPEYMARRMPQVNGCFLQAESEVAAINMCYGAAGAGARVMTSSSSPGISLKQEGISYIAGAELPVVIVNIVRGGPGLGSIQAAQGDYFQATKGGGHGDYKVLTLAPGSVQEAADMVHLAFDLADEYRMPCMILGDGMIGQMMEPVEFKEFDVKSFDKPWATTGKYGDDRTVVNSLYIETEALEALNLRLQANYKIIEEKETRFEEYMTEDAEVILTAYGTVSRICKSAVAQARSEGLKVGMIRPITVWPFPYKAFEEAANRESVKKFVCVEMNAGQMVEDVRLGVNGKKPVELVARVGSVIPTPQEIVDVIKGGVK
ncbi:MAG: 3-methyl-2-oxobutanoate dehydrogenase subunit VorB [Christensenellales bacterium]|jgi:2-oxoglutarate ferredoxin oxidoreductase subunit alpha